jgi:hypothetical protein
MLKSPCLSVAVAALALVLAEGYASADRTKLLEVDLKTGSRRKIDRGGPKTRADRDLDAMLDGATGGSAFSTTDLEKIERALRHHLKAARPRAMPRLLLFLYPGRISRGGLKELREVLVDVDLVVDPCGRTVCQASVAKHLELLGRSIKQAVIRTRRYTIRFQTVTVRTAPDGPSDDYETYRFGADEVVQSGRRPGGGAKLVKRLGAAKAGYEQQITKEVARRVKVRRVRLAKPPRVSRGRRQVSVAMEIQSDRNRYKTDVLGALLGAAEALKKNPLTPPSSQLSVVALVRYRKVERKTFTCIGQPLALHLAGRMSQSELWQGYVNERKKGGTQLSFSDEEARGGVGGGDEDEDDRTQEILAGHFDMLAPCLQKEASRNRRFKGVTLTFSVAANGKATGVGFKERVGASLKLCLKAALGRIRFQRHRGSPRRVEYPMYIQR